jgi:hypothetical protein
VGHEQRHIWDTENAKWNAKTAKIGEFVHTNGYKRQTSFWDIEQREIYIYIYRRNTL